MLFQSRKKRKAEESNGGMKKAKTEDKGEDKALKARHVMSRHLILCSVYSFSTLSRQSIALFVMLHVFCKI